MLAKAFKQDRPIAKDDVDNVGAGRAAKGANHFAPATKKGIPSGMSFFAPWGRRARTPTFRVGGLGGKRAEYHKKSSALPCRRRFDAFGINKTSPQPQRKAYHRVCLFFVCCEAKCENPDLSGGRARRQARGIP